MSQETETKWIEVKDLKTNEWAEVIIGDYGGRTEITGEVHESGLVFGTMSIETEHGVLYLPAEEVIQVEGPKLH